MEKNNDFRLGWAFVVFAALLSADISAKSDLVALDEQFRRPPLDCKPSSFWPWIGGHITREGLQADLDAMEAAGMRGGIIFDLSMYIPEGEVAYGSQAWQDLVQFAITSGHDRGLEIGLLNCPGWATSGGPWVSPEQSMKRLVHTEKTGITPENGPVRIEAPESREKFYRDVAVIALPEKGAAPDSLLPDYSKLSLGADFKGYRQVNPYAAVPAPRFIPQQPPSSEARGAVRPGDILVLSDKLRPDGTLDWEVPPGSWTVLRFGFTSTGARNHPAREGAKGLEVDKMDAAAVQRFFADGVAPVLQRAGGKTSFVAIDSWEAGLSNWTEHFPREFRNRRGYDIIPFLPVLAGRIVGSSAETYAFLHDFRATITDLIAENYHRVMREEAARQGAALAVQPYKDLNMDSAKSGRQLDRILGEFWVNGMFMNWVRRTSGMVETMKEDKRMSAEAFTARPDDAAWRHSPRTLKRVADAALVNGVNDFILHSFVHQPRDDMRPGFTHGRFGTEFSRHNTWWPMAGAFNDYLARCGLMLRQGNRVADFLCLESPGPSSQDRFPAVPAGYDYLFIAPFTLLESKVENGKVVTPGGGKHAAVVLPAVWVADLALLEKLATLQDAGVAVLGPEPVMPAGRNDLAQTEQWNALVGRIFSGAPRRVTTTDLEQAMRERGVGPDFVCEPPGAQLEYAHRRSGDRDIYFVRNPGEEAVQTRALFRVASDRVQLWDPLDGSIRTVPVETAGDGRRAVALDLARSGSVFVVFGVGDGAAEPESARKVSSEIFPTGWKVTFRPPGGEPFEWELPTLGLWNQSDDVALKYFSGTAVYAATFELPETGSDRQVEINLGAVHEMARVWVNGKEAGVCWTPPDCLDITALVQPGPNRLEIEVANTWVNRLIGDEALPAEAEFDGISANAGTTAGVLTKFPDWYRDPTKVASRRRSTFAAWRHYDDKSPLLPSGLAGPVSVRVYEPTPQKEGGN